jgi:hypothetical protein
MNTRLLITMINYYDFCQVLLVLNFRYLFKKLSSARRFPGKVKSKFAFNICHVHKAG